MFRWIAMFILLWFIYQVRHVFPPIIVGGIVAYLVLPVVQALSQKARLPVGIATLLVYAMLASVIVAACCFIGPSIMKEVKELSSLEAQRELVHKAVEQISNVIKWQGDTDQISEQILSSAAATVSKPEQLKEVGESISHLLLSLLVCVVSSIYFTLDSQSVGRFFLRYVPENRRTGIIDLVGQMNRMLSKYVQGQILLILIMSSVAWVFLHFVVHMKYALPVAVFSGFLEIIPVLGPIIATSTATLVGIAQFGPQGAMAIVIFYVVARWIEDYVVVPKIIGHAVELHPLAVIFAVLCGETLAGGLGMLIAIPVAACIKLVLDYYYTGQLPADRRPDKRKKHHFDKGGVSGTHNHPAGKAPEGSPPEKQEAGSDQAALDTAAPQSAPAGNAAEQSTTAGNAAADNTSSGSGNGSQAAGTTEAKN
jgi:predicted PurR-regulated permease PerM